MTRRCGEVLWVQRGFGDTWRDVTYPLPVAAKEVEQLAEIVDETGDLHPVGLAVLAHGLGGLQQVLDLGSVGVGVAGVDLGV
jgi:pimeloyl-ACP methyl ester carboxylesterase